MDDLERPNETDGAPDRPHQLDARCVLYRGGKQTSFRQLTTWAQALELMADGVQIEFVTSEDPTAVRRSVTVQRTDAAFHVRWSLETAGMLQPLAEWRMPEPNAAIRNVQHYLGAVAGEALRPPSTLDAEDTVEIFTTPPRHGRIRVRTESGTQYMIDLDTRYLRRTRGRTASTDPEVAPAAHLRRDDNALKVLRILTLEVGARAVVDLEPLGDPHTSPFTRRTTTIVTSIEPWNEP